jgi:hypothetical protein
MKILAFKGERDFGDKVIELLEMLGGVNKFKTTAWQPNKWLFINENRENAIEKVKGSTYDIITNYAAYTLETFLQKFPFKKHETVIVNNLNSKGIIVKMEWNGSEVIYTCNVDNQTIQCNKYNLTAFKNDTNVCEQEQEKTFPKTYYECYQLLFNETSVKEQILNINEEYAKDITPFIKLKICRDAYWKILNCTDKTNCKFNISVNEFTKKAYKFEKWTTSIFLRFPDRDSRRIFFDNFKELIEECKQFITY